MRMNDIDSKDYQILFVNLLIRVVAGWVKALQNASFYGPEYREKLARQMQAELQEPTLQTILLALDIEPDFFWQKIVLRKFAEEQRKQPKLNWDIRTH